MPALNDTTQAQPVNFFADPFGALGRYADQALQIVAAKSLLDLNDGELPLQINPFGGVGIVATQTAGSAGPTSLWRSTDMLWLGLAGVGVLLAVMIKK